MNYFNFLIYKTKQKYLTFLKCLFLLVKFFYIHFILRMPRTMVNIRLISFPDQVFQKSIFPVHKKKMNITIIFLECFQSQKGQINFPIAFNIFELVLVKSFILNRQNHFLEQVYSKRVFSV